jgi:uncharacterized protein (DUF427 family)
MRAVDYPPDSIKMAAFTPNPKQTVCGWKGTASYYDIKHEESGKVLDGGAWVYEDPKEAAAEIRGHFAFYRPVQTVKE